MFFALSAAALADDLPTAGFDAQQYRLPVDAETSMWADDASLHPGFLARVAAGYMNNPVLYEYDDTGEQVALVGNVLGFDIIPAFTFWRIRLGADLPVYALSTGEAGSGGGLGDIAIDAKLVALDPSTAPLGLAADVRVRVPTTTTTVPLGVDGVGWEAALVASKRAGPMSFAANVGVRGVPQELADASALMASLTLRGNAAFHIGESAGISLDAAGGVALSEGDPSAGEFMLGGWVRPIAPLDLRLGLGRGLGGGVGSPAARVVLAVGFEPGKLSPKPKPTTPTTASTSPTTPTSSTPSSTASSSGSTPTTVTAPVSTAPRPLAELGAGKIVLGQKILFDGSTISGASLPVLNAVAEILASHPEISGVRIESHTDSRMDLEYTLSLTGMRANAVLDYLVARGVSPTRVIAAGYGGTRPIVQGDNAEAWALNDRIEFIVTGP